MRRWPFALALVGVGAAAVLCVVLIVYDTNQVSANAEGGADSITTSASLLAAFWSAACVLGLVSATQLVVRRRFAAALAVAAAAVGFVGIVWIGGVRLYITPFGVAGPGEGSLTALTWQVLTLLWLAAALPLLASAVLGVRRRPPGLPVPPLEVDR